MELDELKKLRELVGDFAFEVHGDSEKETIYRMLILVDDMIQKKEDDD